MKLTSMGPDRTPVFRADHPFVFMIRDNSSGSILFLGRVMNPQPRSSQRNVTTYTSYKPDHKSAASGERRFSGKLSCSPQKSLALRK